jgi:hypothetical protein
VTPWKGDIISYKDHLKKKVMKKQNKDAKCESPRPPCCLLTQLSSPSERSGEGDPERSLVDPTMLFNLDTLERPSYCSPATGGPRLPQL